MKAEYSLKKPLLLGLVMLLTSVAFGQMSPEERTRLEQHLLEYRKIAAIEKSNLIKEAKRLNIPTSYYRGGKKLILVQIINGHPSYETDDNTLSQSTTSADRVKFGGDLGLNLSGAGINIGMWESGLARASHVELVGRVFLRDAEGTSDHATHVGGTLIAAGVLPTAQGYANTAILHSFNSEDDIEELMGAALEEPPIMVTNHSYGTRAGWHKDDDDNWSFTGPDPGQEDWEFGAYDSRAHDFDEAAYYAPYLLIVKSAGNDRDDPDEVVDLDGNLPDCHEGGYDCIPTFGIAKNIVTVGAVENFAGGYNGPVSVVMSGFSGWGPADDGRIKPDIVAPGVSIYSSIGTGDMDYDNFWGTSMASPAVAGGSALLYEHWSNVIGGVPRAATMKGLLIESADEAGNNIGPDYQFGWGQMNVSDAAEIITTTSYDGCDHVIEDVIGEEQTKDYLIRTNGEQPLKITLVWHDPPYDDENDGDIDPTDRNLMNDLNLQLIHESGTPYFPWVMLPAFPGAAANRGVNNLDNVEQVLVLDPPPGVYTMRVTAPEDLEDDEQAFSLWFIGNDAGQLDRVISNLVINDDVTYTAYNNLQFGPNLTVSPSANARGFAGESVRLVPGFHAQSGSEFNARIEPGGGCGAFTMDIKANNYVSTGFEEKSSTSLKVEDISPEGLLEEANLLVPDLKIFPNPIREKLNVQLVLPKESMINISLANSFGQLMPEVSTKGNYAQGQHQFSFGLTNLPAGIYQLQVHTEFGQLFDQVVVVK